MKKILLIILSLTIFGTACNEDFLEVKNNEEYDFESYFTSDAQFDEAVMATYAVMLHRGMYARDYYFLFDLLGNDAQKDAPLLGDLAQLHDYSFGTNQEQITSLWRSLYRMILRSNLVIDRAGAWEPTSEVEQANKEVYIGEAKFFRAYAYFHLVFLWGPVPYKADFESSTEFFAPRTEEAIIWESIENDLQDASAALPLTRDASQLGRLTRGAAIAMLGRVYLYQDKFSEAEAELSKLMNAPYTYSLTTNFDDQFNPGNGQTSETIFDVPHFWGGWGQGNAFYMYGGQEAWGGKATHTGRAMEYGWNDWRNVFIHESAVAAFTYDDESGTTYQDPRAALTFYGDAASGADTDFCDGCAADLGNFSDYYLDENGDTLRTGPWTYPYNAANGYRFRKFNNYESWERESQPQSNINSQVIRFADVKLMLAEAIIRGNGNLEDARQQINDVRNRVGAFEYSSAYFSNNALDILKRERRLELCGEQKRYFDLIRWGEAKEVINAEKQAEIGREPFQDKHYRFPIPQLERDINPEVAAEVSDGWN
jgi:hypothetical protein